VRRCLAGALYVWETDDMKMNLRAVAMWPLAVLLMCRPLSADATNEKALSELPAEFRTIIEGNQATLESIHTMHAKITTVTTSSFVKKGTRTIQKTEEIWYDKSHVRTDVVDSRFVGEDATPLILSEGPGGVKTTLEPPAIGHMEIDSDVSWLVYVPNTGSMVILAPDWNERRIQRDYVLLNCQFLQGSTLKTTVLACAKRKEFFTVKREAVDGEDCLLLECEFPKPQITQKVWVDPSRGYCIKKQQLLQRGSMFEEYTATLKEYAPGLWWFESAKAIGRGGPNEGDSPGRIADVSVDSLTLNEPIDAKIFTLAGTNVPPGTRVRDTIADSGYIYGTGPVVSPQDVDSASDVAARAEAKQPSSHGPATGMASDSNKPARVDNPALDTRAFGSSEEPGTHLPLGVPIVLAIAASGVILLVFFRKGRKARG
jgi:hypothetical protein